MEEDIGPLLAGQWLAWDVQAGVPHPVGALGTRRRRAECGCSGQIAHHSPFSTCLKE